MLSNRQQIARLRHLAGQALGAYPLVAPELRFVAHGENTTFRVDAMVAGGPDRFLLRVHRPARHGRRLDSAAAVGSELDWLTALRADTGLSVPEPVRTTNGKLTTAAASPAVPEPRVCSLLRWMDGRVHSSVPRLVHFTGSEASWRGCTITLASGVRRPASRGSAGTGKRSSAT
jgi:Ser/Thr protein kinase RdoA (MazF antagonist)